MNAIAETYKFQNQEPPQQTRRFARTKGAIGTQIIDGMIFEEDHNKEWIEEQAIKNARKMVKTDPTVRSTLLSIKLPIMAAAVRIEPASEDSADLDIAEFVEQNLFLNPNYAYMDWLRHVLFYLDFGFEVLEKSYEVRDGHLHWKRWEHRKPETIDQWMTDKDNDLIEIRQISAYDARVQDFRDTKIPFNQAFHISNNQEGLNFRGESILRSAYFSWLSKQKQMEIDSIKNERFGCGIPEIEVMGTGKMDDAIDALEKLRYHEKMYITKTEEYKVGLFPMGNSTGVDVIGSIKYHDDQIRTNILQDFMSLGKDGVGSLALSNDKIDFFMLSLDSVANHIEDTMNNGSGKMQHVKQLVDLNFANVKEYPKYKIDRIKLEDKKAVAETLKTLKEIGFVDPSDDETRQHVGETFKIPMPEFTPVKPDTQPPVIEDPEEEPAPKMSFQRRGLTAMEKDVAKMEEVDTELNKATVRLQGSVDVFRKDINDSLIESGVNALTKSHSVQQLQQRIDKFNIPFLPRLTNSVVSVSKDLFGFGRETVKNELRRQGVKLQNVTAPVIENIREAEQTIRPTTVATITAFGSKVKSEWSKALLAMFKSGQINTEFLREQINRVSNNLFGRSIKEIAHESFGLGRTAESFKQQDKIESFVRSEVFDENICQPCIGIDGAEFTANDPLFSSVNRGVFNECRGGDLCRGISIVVAK